MNSKDYRNIREAYLQVYEPQELTEEQVWEGVEEWVNALLQEGYDLSDYTWEEMYEAYLSEAPQQETMPYGITGKKVLDTATRLANPGGALGSAVGKKIGNEVNYIKKTKVGGIALDTANKLLNPVGALAGAAAKKIGNEVDYIKKTAYGSKSDGGNVKSTTVPGKPASTDYKSKFAGARDAAFEKAKQIKGSPVLGPKIVGSGSAGGSSSGSGGSGGSTPKPTATTTPTAPKPAAGAQTGDKEKDMATFAKANPKLAAAQAEKDRIRGTSQTDNPSMKDMTDKMPMTPSVQSPTLAKDLDGGSGNQSLLDNPNASKAATPKKPITSSFDYFDAVKGYLIDEGYADTEHAAEAIMANMSDAWVRSIIG